MVRYLFYTIGDLTYQSPLVFITSWYIIPFFLRAFAELRKAAISFLMSVRLSNLLHGTTRLPLDGFLYFIFEYFSKMCRENSSFIKLEQK